MLRAASYQSNLGRPFALGTAGRVPPKSRDVVVNERREGFTVNGRPVIDPEGSITMYAYDVVTGDITFGVDAPDGNPSRRTGRSPGRRIPLRARRRRQEHRHPRRLHLGLLPARKRRRTGFLLLKRDWRAHWLSTEHGPIAVTLENGAKEIFITDLRTGKRVLAFRRALGIADMVVIQQPSGVVEVHAQLAFSRKSIEDAVGFLEREGEVVVVVVVVE